jgi:hypothetical protein
MTDETIRIIKQLRSEADMAEHRSTYRINPNTLRQAADLLMTLDDSVVNVPWNKRPEYDPMMDGTILCVCGHEYRRHFDTYDNMRPVGCKYCDCKTFQASVIPHLDNGCDVI